MDIRGLGFQSPQYTPPFLFSVQLSGEDYQHIYHLEANNSVSVIYNKTFPWPSVSSNNSRVHSNQQDVSIWMSQNFFFPACTLVRCSEQVITSSILGISDRAGMLQLDISRGEHTELYKPIPVIWPQDLLHTALPKWIPHPQFLVSEVRRALFADSHCHSILSGGADWPATKKEHTSENTLVPVHHTIYVPHQNATRTSQMMSYLNEVMTNHTSHDQDEHTQNLIL